MSAVSATGLTNYADYSALNGISGSYGGLGANYGNSIFNSYGNFGNYGNFGYYYGMDVDSAKQNLQNNYELTTLQQSYGNKQSVQTLDWSQLCANVSTLLQQGRTDDAIVEYNKLTKSMADAQQYSGYSESQIKALAQRMYAQTMGSNLVDDIDTNASGAFVQGLKAGVPIIGTLFAQGNSKEDMISEVTGVNQSKGTKVAKGLGAIAAGALTGAGTGAALGLCGGPLLAPLTSTAGAIGGAIIGGIMSIGKLLFS